jgi:hypothetical protein
MTETYAATTSYTTADVEKVFRRFSADIFMIADSTGAITRKDAEDYAHDTGYLAKRGYLAKVDVTLFSYAVEAKAAVYRVNENNDVSSSDRPGGVLWPKVNGARLRVVISYTSAYDADARTAVSSRLKIRWSSCSDDLSHKSLARTATRAYASNGFGLHREDLT